ncbi:MAG: prolyl oligopeptidase family serine peptidase [Nitriliruptorales bacterium]|nr:prolyl oligopeptidase family serine peptidase [Nitriliruptorales bacterium]
MSCRQDAHASFPRQYAATQRFSLGQPRGVTVSPDGGRVVFLRALSGRDPATGLWVLDTAGGRERLVGDPAALGTGDGVLTEEERLRRERVRESATGITSYATDRAVRIAAFAVAGQLFTADLIAATLTPFRRVPIPDTAHDPRPSPDGSRVAFSSERGVSVVDAEAAAATRVAGEDDPNVTWGQAEFIAGEEMGRTRGFWWSPDGNVLAVARVDVSGVQRWHLGDPTDPTKPPASVAYPAAGTPNADVSLHLVPLRGGDPTRVIWDRLDFPYLADVVWQEHGPLTLVVQSRDQKVKRLLAVDPASGKTTDLRETHDQHWVDLVPGVPRWLPDGRLVDVVDVDDTRSLALADQVCTPRRLQVRGVAGVGSDAVYLTASSDPIGIGVWEVPLDGAEPRPLSAEHGVAGATVGGRTVVLARRDLGRPGVDTIVHSPHGDSPLHSVAERPPLDLRVELHRLGRRELATALVLPSTWREVDGPLPVLLDPYAGPHAQRVLASHDAYLVSQWFADAGFAVVIVDGRGTPGRGPAWERSVAGDLSDPVLEDQVDALQAAAQMHPALDLSRVAIRGWSFGGYLAALAVLRRPEVFHAAIAGAPVTDWTLYDTHYTERYLGLPQEQPEVYRHNSLLEDAPNLTRPLLLIHGLSDDNVVAAHTLRLSGALFEGGRRHQVLPLSGVTHMTPQEKVAENLLWLQLAFLHDALRLD